MLQKKKVLIFHHCGFLGGGALSCFDVIDMLSEKYDVCLGIVSPSREVEEIVNKLNVKEVYKISSYPSITYHNANHDFFKSLLKKGLTDKHKNIFVDIAKESYPDLVIINSSVLSPVVEPLKKQGYKVMCIVRETMYGKKTFAINKMIRKRLSQCDSVGFLTDYDLKSWSVNSKSDFVLPDVVNKRFYQEDSVPKSEKRVFNILYLGGIALEKGIETLVEAYSLLPQDIESKLVVLGSDVRASYSNPLKRLLQKNKADRIESVRRKIKDFSQNNKEIDFVGIVSETSKYYETCDVVVFPVLQVHQPRPAYEAGFFKKPVILPDYENFKENVIDNVNGAYYQPENAQSLADVMYKLALEPQRVKALGEKNAEFTEKKHSIDVVGELLIDQVEKIIQ